MTEGRRPAFFLVGRLLGTVSGDVVDPVDPDLPKGSAFLNLFAKGCLSRLGRD